jgi:hypothetical protein
MNVMRRWLLACLVTLFLPDTALVAGPEPEDASHEMEMNSTPDYPGNPADCGDMQIWDVGMAMCMPFPMPSMPMRMVMLSGNAFGDYIWETGPRGRNTFASTNMIMFDIGTTFADRHYFNVDFMGTAELWTVPTNGYPLLLQIGEEQANGQPFLDAQHPHSSPIMGLTFSDTIRLGEGKDAVKVFFAPRGETTEGPVAFMHRATGMMNPDAPLGHHIGQDVGHISSTVVGASLKLTNFRFELSGFHGQEPSPTQIDLPLGIPDSLAGRVVYEFSPDVMLMGSLTYVTQPEINHPDLTYEVRYSASAYTRASLSNRWKFYNTLIFGAVINYDETSLLNSFGEEFWFTGGAPNIWGRIEVLQRTPAELSIVTASNANVGEWVAAFTIGYTHTLLKWEGAVLGLGASVSKDVIPADFAGAYGGSPWSGKVFLHLRGMRMWDS